MNMPKQKGGGNLDLWILWYAIFIVSQSFDFKLLSVRVSKYQTTSIRTEIYVPE
jgi:hypothetical protein